MVDLDSGGPASGLFLSGGVVKSRLGEQDRHIVQDHFASLLQVQNLVILVGSGASFHLGSPQTRNLDNTAVQALIHDAGQEIESSDGDLLAFLNPGDKGDLEKLLNGLQLAASLAEQASLSEVTFGTGEHSKSFTKAQIDKLKGKINVAFAHACQLPRAGSGPKDPLAAHRQFLSRIIRSRRANLPRPKVFTTNYDLVIERALDELGYPYIDGFSGTVDRRLNLAYYGLDFHRVETTSQQVVARADSALYLHKIHGSLNWKAVVGGASGVTTLEVVQVREGSATVEEPVLIYPTTAKEGDSLSYPYSDLMRLLSDAVQQNDTAVVTIGYGYGDPHINRILIRSLAINPAINILAVDPYAVMGKGADLTKALLDDELVGSTLAARGHATLDTPVGALAAADDSRIAVLTGKAGEFVHMVDLLPEPGLDLNVNAPAAIMTLIESLERFTETNTAMGASNDE
ncbi:SIR2 family protein [Salinibacterium sp. SYSU T00001]|uniref:SIR2 family protein n=1 Tax=Homoserinimonas sedimenticola TaxID=2986805 RepID=UPI002235888A|nr:SIR2 family protein [Salinibacterium sedimenticola]MCW4384178.1 SIR2 family protein [Salinibacterium sedimenticola]